MLGMCGAITPLIHPCEFVQRRSYELFAIKLNKKIITKKFIEKDKGENNHGLL
jgi:hypothetical protein